MDNLLEVSNLNISFLNGGEPINVVSGLTFHVAQNEILGIVGESGSGKSITSLAVMGLLPKMSVDIKGKVLFADRDLLSINEGEMQQIRGNRISMIFQEPMTSLNPLHTCEQQIIEPMLIHRDISKKDAKIKALELLESCGIPDAQQRLHEYPHQLSGGMRQRIMIAIALACDPDLLIADEPTTALDVTIQAQILRLLKDIQKKRNMGIIMITHDLGIVSDFCHRVMVMYCGEIVEVSSVDQLFKNPLHPYTKGLIQALPNPSGRKNRLQAIQGMVPNAGEMPSGCYFHPRCEYARPQCKVDHPNLKTYSDGRWVRCFLLDNEEQGATKDE